MHTENLAAQWRGRNNEWICFTYFCDLSV